MDWNKILQVKNVTKNYGKGESRTAALRGISFDVLEGEFLGIMGDSGSGKTTLLNCIATMTRPTSGEILLNGTDISTFRGAKLAKYRGGKIGYLYQEFELLDNLTARENIVLPLALHGITQKQAQGRLVELAGRLDIVPVLDRFPSQMSGGQKQRETVDELGLMQAIQTVDERFSDHQRQCGQNSVLCKASSGPCGL